MRDVAANPFSSAFLERRAETRLDANWPHSALEDPATRFIVARGTLQLIRHHPEVGAVFLDRTAALIRQSSPAQLIQLGWYEGRRCVLLDAAPEAQAPPDSAFEELRPVMHELPDPEAALLLYARALLIWRARHRHCGVCGAPVSPFNAGHVLRCTSSECGEQFFPRLDPAIIVLVADGEWALLGRQSSWPPGRYSTLAGFVEPGESLEDCVVREVAEETGAAVTQVRYFGSQPWPFPASLMLGFHAIAARAPIRLDGELEDARWFHATELETTALRVPPRQTIARRLIEAWFERVMGRPLATAT